MPEQRKPENREAAHQQALSQVKRLSPTFDSMDREGDLRITTSPLINQLLNLLGGIGNDTVGEGTSWGGSMLPVGPNISIHDSHIGKPESLAHEAGHIRQQKLGLPVKNDEEADYLVRELERNSGMFQRAGLLPTSLPVPGGGPELQNFEGGDIILPGWVTGPDGLLRRRQ